MPMQLEIRFGSIELAQLDWPVCRSAEAKGPRESQHRLKRPKELQGDE